MNLSAFYLNYNNNGKDINHLKDQAFNVKQFYKVIFITLNILQLMLQFKTKHLVKPHFKAAIYSKTYRHNFFDNFKIYFMVEIKAGLTI